MAVIPIPDKTGQLEDKRVIKVAGKVLAPLSSESPSLPIGTIFKASITSDPSTSVVATTPKGNSVTIKQVKNFAYPNTQWQGDDEKITVALVKHKGREVPLVSLNGSGLGILDFEGETKLKEMKLLSSDKSFTFSAKLQSSPSTSANIQVKPNTVLYPWQQKDKEMEMEQKRVFYREQYETYLKEFANKPKFAKASRKEIDVHVAARAIADTQDKIEVACILSQSDVVREWKESVPTSRTWEDFTKQARDYVQTIQNEANRRLQAKCVETTLS